MQQYRDPVFSLNIKGPAVCNTTTWLYIYGQSVCDAKCKIVQTCNIIQLSPEGEVNSGGYIYWDLKRRGIYLALLTDPEGDICFSIYRISWIKMKKSKIL